MTARHAVFPLLTVAACVLLLGWLASRSPPDVSPLPSSPRFSIDVNVASQRELESLPGVGPSMAKAIIDSRDEHGPFQALADLDRVPGIGPATIEQLADLLRVSPPGNESVATRQSGGDHGTGSLLE